MQGEWPAGRKLYGQFLRNGVRSRDSGLDGSRTGEDSIDVVRDDPGIQAPTFYIERKHLCSDFERSYSLVLPTD